MRHNRCVTSDDAPETGAHPGDAPRGGADRQGQGIRSRATPDDDEDAGKRRSGHDFPRSGTIRRGYDVSQVEEFLRSAERALRSDPPTMAPYELQDVRFRGVRWRRGYDMRAVDEHLEELHARLRERRGEDSLSGIQGRESVRQHRTAFWIYMTAVVLTVAIVVLAVSQMR